MQATQLRYVIKFVADMDKAVKFHRRTAFKGARDICNCPHRILRIQMEHDAPCNRSIEQSFGEGAGLNNSSNGKRLGAVLLKVCKHRTRTV